MLKIGVFDSGLGGLTIVKSLKKHIKGADIFYIADTKNAPYGEKTEQEIVDFSLNIAQFFIKKHNIDTLIVACNTATSAAILQLRQKYPKLIIIGTEPGIKPAISHTSTGSVGVLATPATLGGTKYRRLVKTLTEDKSIKIFEQPCPGLVNQIENAHTDHPKTVQMLRRWLEPMKKNRVDTIVLGCTHYPLVAHIIKEIMADNIRLIHTGEAIAKRLLALSQTRGHKNEGVLNIRLFATGEIDKKSVENIFGFPQEILSVAI